MAIPDPARTHVPALDGVRGLAVLLVVVVHAYYRGPDFLPAGVERPALLGATFATGWTGVELFFVLSGFLITSILLEAKRRGDSLGQFYVRRAARIMPAFFVVFTSVGLLSFVPISPLVDQVTADAWRKWWWYALSINNYFGWFGVDATAANKALGPLWSVASEQQFYLVWPLVIQVFDRAQLRLVLPALLALNIAARLAALQAGIAPADVYIASITHLDGIIIGSMLALHREQLNQARWLQGDGIVAIAGAVLLAAFAAMGTTESLDPLMQTYGYPLIAVFFAVLIVRAMGDGPVHALFSSRTLRTLGKYSYFIYLTHWPAMLLCDQLQVPGGPLVWFGYVVALLVVLTLLAMVSWRLFEQPIIQAVKRRPRPSTPALKQMDIPQL